MGFDEGGEDDVEVEVEEGQVGEEEGQVVEVTDGDSVWCRGDNGASKDDEKVVGGPGGD